MSGESFDTSGLQEVFFDDIKDLSVQNGVFRCTLYAYRRLPGTAEPVYVPVLNLAMPVSIVPTITGKALDMVGSEAIRSAKEFVRDKLMALH